MSRVKSTCTVTNTGYNVYAGTGVVSHNYVTEQECVDLGTAAGATIIQYSGTGNYPVCFYGPDTIQDRQCSRYGCGCGTGNCWPNTQQYRCSYGN